MCVLYTCMPVGTTRGMVTLRGQKITRVEQLNLGKAGITAGIYAKFNYSCLLVTTSGIYQYSVCN